MWKRVSQIKLPNSIHIKKKNGQYWVSFSYEDKIDESLLATQREHLDFLKSSSREFLESYTLGIDRGVVRPVQAGDDIFDFSVEQKRQKIAKEWGLKRYQRRMARQDRMSNRRKRIRSKLSRCHQKIANIRKDFCHKTSHKIVESKEAKIIVFEDLKTKNITKRPKAKKSDYGKWLKNHGRAKAGLNKAILDKGWHFLETFTKYKAHRAGKAFFKISAHHTSQECVVCDHIHPNNRKRQDLFLCERCGHSDNADHNAVLVIKKRAIKLILNSGTELSERGVLLDNGRGAVTKTRGAKATRARSKEASKKKRMAVSAA